MNYRNWRWNIGYAVTTVNMMVQKIVLSPKGFRVIMYHAVGSKVPGDIYGLYNMAPERFKEQMQFLFEFTSGCVTRLSELPEQGMAITFDDGYRDTLEVVAPILTSLKMPFTVFVTPGFILSGQPIYLSVVGLRELAAVPGASIGAHGYSHRRLTECNNQQLQEELTNGRKWLEDTLGQPVKTMSYPHGAVNQSVRKAAAATGYLVAASSRFGANLSDYDPLWLARTDIWAQDDRWSFRAKLAGGWDWLRFRAP
jgi:peptidoglycan/xylan/chitin deacetylase (PgdA/CDA1 family)